MLGLWLEQEFLVKDCSNRELALEVAAMRLARWPAVRQLEEWLNASGNLPAPGGSGSGSGSPPLGGGGHGSSSHQPVSRRSGTARSAEAPQTSPHAPASPAPSGRAPGIEDEAEAVTEPVQEPVPDAEPEPRPAAGRDLEATAKADRGVILAQKILGGDVVAVFPDGEGT
jgi:hypothetical protein